MHYNYSKIYTSQDLVNWAERDASAAIKKNLNSVNGEIKVLVFTKSNVLLPYLRTVRRTIITGLSW